MSRRDTIILSVVINTLLLAVLFFSAAQTKPNPKPHKAETAIAKNATEPVKQTVSEKNSSVTAVDPLDQAIEKYTAKLKEDKKKETPNRIVKPLPKVVEEKKPAGVGEQVVTVVKGDMLEKIARQHQVSVEEIMRENGLTTTALRIGQKLKIPSSKQKAKPSNPAKKISEPKFYVVKGGDNLWTIAMKHKLQVDQLLKLNNLNEEKARKIRPGDKLRIE